MRGDNDDENIGISIVRRAVEEPLRALAANAGEEGSLIVQEVKRSKGPMVTTSRQRLHRPGQGWCGRTPRR